MGTALELAEQGDPPQRVRADPRRGHDVALQQQILGFGIATIGLLAGAAFVSRADPLRSELLVVFLPLVCYLAVTIWFSEVVRMLRAGGFLVTVEKKLDTCGDGSLEWEYGVAKSRLRRVQGKALFAPDPDRLRLLAVTALFFALAAESIMLGWHDASSFARAFAVAVGAAAAILLRLLFGLRVAEWNEVLEIDTASRGTALEARVVRGLRRLVPSFPPRLSTRPRRPSSAPRRRLALTPATAPNA